VARKLEISGEAFARVEVAEPAVTGKFAELRKIVGLRNRIIHGYDAVDEEIIWDVAINKLPALRQQVGDINTGQNGTNGLISIRRFGGG
jgi:uncharacterized protein with HEPN domain